LAMPSITTSTAGVIQLAVLAPYRSRGIRVTARALCAAAFIFPVLEACRGDAPPMKSSATASSTPPALLTPPREAGCVPPKEGWHEPLEQGCTSLGHCVRNWKQAQRIDTWCTNPALNVFASVQFYTNCVEGSAVSVSQADETETYFYSRDGLLAGIQYSAWRVSGEYGAVPESGLDGCAERTDKTRCQEYNWQERSRRILEKKHRSSGKSPAGPKHSQLSE